MRKGQNSNSNEPANWIPEAFRGAAQNIANDAMKEITDSKHDEIVIGLGSGPMTAVIVQEMGRLSYKEKIECIPSSTEIKSVAEHANLKVVDEIRIPEIEVVFDGADQIDSKYNMIKGGGGALLREKILHSATKKVVITAESFKYTDTFDRSVPIEILPFSQHILLKKLQESQGAAPKLRGLKEGYPYVTENGNFILDTTFPSPYLNSDIENKERLLKNFPGVLEVGLFTRRADIYYEAKEHDTFDIKKL